MSELPQQIDPAQGHAEGAEERLDEVESILLPYQQAWVSDDAQVKIHEKSRRIGISWAEAADAALYAAQTTGANVYYLAYNQDMTKQFIEDCAFWAKFYNLAASEVQEVVLEDEDRDVKVFQIEFDSGHIIQALPSTPRNLRSKGAPGERAILDEFAFVDAPDELMKAALAFVMWGGQVRVISTHDGVDNPFNQLVEEARAGKKPYSVHRTTFEEAVGQGLFKRICLMRGETWRPEKEEAWMEDVYDFYGSDAKEELDVIPSQSSGRYLSRLLVERCMDDEIPVLRLALDDEFAMRPAYEREIEIGDWCERRIKPLLEPVNRSFKSYFGMDFARHGDLSALIPAQELASLTRRALFALELRNVPFEQQRQILFYVVRRLPRFVFGALDATGNGAYLAEVAAQEFGFSRIEQIKLNNPWYLEHMPKYRAAFEDQQILLPQDSDVLDDHMDIVRERGVPKVPAGETRKGMDGQPRHGDTAIAGCLLWYASQQAGAPIEYDSVGESPAQSQAHEYAGTKGGKINENKGFGTIGGMNYNGYL